MHFKPLGVAFCLAAALIAAPAFALMPPQSYLTARAEAPRHVQIKILKVQGPVNNAMGCIVTGRVIKTFRGDLNWGRKLKLKVDCNPPKGGFTGPQIYNSEKSLRAARFAEVYLTADDPPEVMLWQFHIIDQASNEARCNAQEWTCD
jgi:hypothetical protein